MLEADQRKKSKCKDSYFLLFRERKEEKNFVLCHLFRRTLPRMRTFFRGQISGSGESIFREEQRKYFARKMYTCHCFWKVGPVRRRPKCPSVAAYAERRDGNTVSMNRIEPDNTPVSIIGEQKKASEREKVNLNLNSKREKARTCENFKKENWNL